MSISENQKLELFNEFYEWLKSDGLTPKKSERLHRKKIFSGLLADDKMTIENFQDFLSTKKANKLLGYTNSIIGKQFTVMIEKIVYSGFINSIDESLIEKRKYNISYSTEKGTDTILPYPLTKEEISKYIQIIS